MSIEEEILKTQEKIFDTANRIINEYKDKDIETIKSPEFLWTEQEKYENYDEIKMLAALKKYVDDYNKLPKTEDEKLLLVNYFDRVTALKGGKRRRFRKSKKIRRKSKRRKSRRTKRRKYF